MKTRIGSGAEKPWLLTQLRPAGSLKSFHQVRDEITPAFTNYILDLIKVAVTDYGLKAGPGVTYEDYNKEYEDGKTPEEYWQEVVAKRLLKVALLYEEAWDSDTQTLRVDTDFSKYLIYPDESNGFPAVWSSGNHAEKNREAFENANKWILVTKKPNGKDLLRRIKLEVILEWYDRAPRGEKCKTVCKKLDETLGDKLLGIDPTLEDWLEYSYSGALRNKPENVRPWVSITYKREVQK